MSGDEMSRRRKPPSVGTTKGQPGCDAETGRPGLSTPATTWLSMTAVVNAANATSARFLDTVVAGHLNERFYIAMASLDHSRPTHTHHRRYQASGNEQQPATPGRCQADAGQQHHSFGLFPRLPPPTPPTPSHFHSVHARVPPFPRFPKIALETLTFPAGLPSSFIFAC
jgi:hypothetical protein